MCPSYVTESDKKISSSLQWSLWSVGGWELVPGSQQPLLHLQQLLPLGNRRLPNYGAGGVEVRLRRGRNPKRPSSLIFSLSRLTLSRLPRPTTADQLCQDNGAKINTATRSFHRDVRANKWSKNCWIPLWDFGELKQAWVWLWWIVSWLAHSCGFWEQDWVLLKL